MPRPIHFEIPAENPERAMQFYSSVFGWKFNKWDGPMDYWVISTGTGGRTRNRWGPDAAPRPQSALREYHRSGERG